MNCTCKACVSYDADGGNTIVVKLDKIDWCSLHGAAEELVTALTNALWALEENKDKIKFIGPLIQNAHRVLKKAGQ